MAPLRLQACAAVGGSAYRPEVVFIVVQKNHGTRIFPADANNQDKSGNILPGTAVDRGICSRVGRQAGGAVRCPEASTQLAGHGYTYINLIP